MLTIIGKKFKILLFTVQVDEWIFKEEIFKEEIFKSLTSAVETKESVDAMLNVSRRQKSSVLSFTVTSVFLSLKLKKTPKTGVLDYQKTPFKSWKCVSYTL